MIKINMISVRIFPHRKLDKEYVWKIGDEEFSDSLDVYPDIKSALDYVIDACDLTKNGKWSAFEVDKRVVFRYEALCDTNGHELSKDRTNVYNLEVNVKLSKFDYVTMDDVNSIDGLFEK